MCLPLKYKLPVYSRKIESREWQRRITDTVRTAMAQGPTLNKDELEIRTLAVVTEVEGGTLSYRGRSGSYCQNDTTEWIKWIDESYKINELDGQGRNGLGG